MAHFVIGLIILSTILLQCLGGVYLSSLIDNKNSYNDLNLFFILKGNIKECIVNEEFD